MPLKVQHARCEKPNQFATFLQKTDVDFAKDRVMLMKKAVAESTEKLNQGLYFSQTEIQIC